MTPGMRLDDPPTLTDPPVLRRGDEGEEGQRSVTGRGEQCGTKVKWKGWVSTETGRSGTPVLPPSRRTRKTPCGSQGHTWSTGWGWSLPLTGSPPRPAVRRSPVPGVVEVAEGVRETPLRVTTRTLSRPVGTGPSLGRGTDLGWTWDGLGVDLECTWGGLGIDLGWTWVDLRRTGTG